MRLMLLTLSFVLSGMSAFAAEEIATANTTSVKASEEVNASNAVEGVKEVQLTEAPKKNLTESEIPLNLQNTKKADTGGGGLFRIIFSLSILGVLGFGGIFVLRKYSVPRDSKHQTQIKVLQQHYLGPKKSLAIIRVAGESILVGVTDHNISLIKSLSLLDDEVPEEAPPKFNTVIQDFQEEEEVQETRPSKKYAARELDKDEEFAISGIKDIVSKRLKGMRSFQ